MPEFTHLSRDHTVHLMTGLRDAAGPLVVLDDDPTGTQAVARVPVILACNPAVIAATAATSPTAIHLLTNSRAYPPEQARELVREAAAATIEVLARPRFALRGDSTLRAHLLEEYLALCDVAYAGRTPPLLLVPALPAAGRITAGGVHYLVRDGRRVPLHETEYARDAGFAYSDACLLQWAEDRSGGFFQRAGGREVDLERVRSGGPTVIADALLELADAGRAAVCVPDAESLDDLAVIAEGLGLAEAAGAEIVVRSAPTFVGVASGALATERARPPAPGTGVLVVCGSYVPSTTRQLEKLIDAYPRSLVEVDVVALASDGRKAEIDRAAGEAARLLALDGLAVVATRRERPQDLRDFASGQRVATGLAEVVGRIEPLPGVVLAKGGITSAVTAKHGLAAETGIVVGPLVDGVALWHLHLSRGEKMPFVVFPGNVGDERTLLEVVELVLEA
jgi:uncharacterized protein YgbK (DUF1537 family)